MNVDGEEGLCTLPNFWRVESTPLLTRCDVRQCRHPVNDGILAVTSIVNRRDRRVPIPSLLRWYLGPKSHHSHVPPPALVRRTRAAHLYRTTTPRQRLTISHTKSRPFLPSITTITTAMSSLQPQQPLLRQRHSHATDTDRPRPPQAHGTDRNATARNSQGFRYTAHLQRRIISHGGEQRAPNPSSPANNRLACRLRGG